MSERRISKRNAEKKTSQSLVTFRVAISTETALQVPPGPPSGHSKNTLVVHDNPIATDHQIDTKDGVSIREKEQDLERSRQEKKRLERQRLKNGMVFKIERAKQEQKRLERHNLERETRLENKRTRLEQEQLKRRNLEIEKREIKKHREEAEELAS